MTIDEVRSLPNVISCVPAHPVVDDSPDAFTVRFANGEVGTYRLGCNYCEDELRCGETFFPRHQPSSRCQSGKRPHCSCDTCF